MPINDAKGFWNKAILNYLEEVDTLDDVDKELDVDMLKAKQTITIKKLYPLSIYTTFISRIPFKMSKNIVSLMIKTVYLRTAF